MEESEVRLFRPCKLFAVIMSIIALILMIVSVAGPDWMEVSFHQGAVKSWGLWWECFKVTGSLEMCVETDWLSACAALVLIGLLCMVATSIMGSIGLCLQKRILFVICGAISIFAIVLQIICLIVYPVKFVKEVREDKSYRAEAQHIDLDWTYGVAWGAVCFMFGAAILFLIRKDPAETTTHKDNTPPPYYLNFTEA